MTKQFVRTNVAGIIFNNYNELLLAQRAYTKKLAPGIWHLPGGKVEEKENLREALCRELKEEFDLDHFLFADLKPTQYQFEYQIGGDWHRTILFLITLKASFTPKLDFESEQAVFVTPQVALSLIGTNDQLYDQHVTIFKKLGFIQ